MTPAAPQLTAADLITNECYALLDLLLAKNRKYGNSALAPVRIFSRADAAAQLDVRIDDKLSRIANRQDDDDEDTEQDLLGYLILRRIARRLAANAGRQVDIGVDWMQPND